MSPLISPPLVVHTRTVALEHDQKHHDKRRQEGTRHHRNQRMLAGVGTPNSTIHDKQVAHGTNDARNEGRRHPGNCNGTQSTIHTPVEAAPGCGRNSSTTRPTNNRVGGGNRHPRPGGHENERHGTHECGAHGRHVPRHLAVAVAACPALWVVQWGNALAHSGGDRVAQQNGTQPLGQATDKEAVDRADGSGTNRGGPGVGGIVGTWGWVGGGREVSRCGG